jgi:hypothetical protein
MQALDCLVCTCLRLTRRIRINYRNCPMYLYFTALMHIVAIANYIFCFKVIEKTPPQDQIRNKLSCWIWIKVFKLQSSLKKGQTSNIFSFDTFHFLVMRRPSTDKQCNGKDFETGIKAFFDCSTFFEVYSSTKIVLLLLISFSDPDLDTECRKSSLLGWRLFLNTQCPEGL